MDAVKVYEDNAGGISYVVGSTCYAIGWGLPDGAGLKDLNSYLDDWLRDPLPAEDADRVVDTHTLVAERGSDWTITLYPQRMGAAARRYFGLGD